VQKLLKMIFGVVPELIRNLVSRLVPIVIVVVAHLSQNLFAVTVVLTPCGNLLQHPQSIVFHSTT